MFLSQIKKNYVTRYRYCIRKHCLCTVFTSAEKEVLIILSMSLPYLTPGVQKVSASCRALLNGIPAHSVEQDGLDL
jgi:hypothetical protein